MAWTTPKTDWTNGELVVANDMNAIGENLAALKQLATVPKIPATAIYTTTAPITTRSTSFVDVDSDNLNLTITTTGGDVLVMFSASVDHNGDSRGFYDIAVDGTRQGGSYGIRASKADQEGVVTFAHVIQDLSAGSHSFKLQWRVSRGWADIEAHAQFWVREI